MQQETLKNNKKDKDDNSNLDFTDITNDPITNLYDKSISKLNVYIDDFFDDYLKQNNESIDKINNFKSIIFSKNKALYQTKLERKITKRKVTNFFIGLYFILIFGFFFINKFKENRKVIKEYKAYEKQQYDEMFDLNNQKENLVRGVFSFFDYDLAINSILNRIGFKTVNTYDENLIKELSSKFLSSNKEDIVTIKSYLSLVYKNTPIYDLAFYKRNFRDVVTSKTESFPYRATETYTTSNGSIGFRVVTRYEHLTAYHTENTPFVDENNFLILKTNFIKDLNFTTFSPNKKYVEFENKEFTKKFKVSFLDHENKTNSEILQYFTIKAQEDYLKWDNNFKGDIPQLIKNGNMVIVPSKHNPVFIDLKSKINYLNSISIEEQVNTNINKLKADILNYLSDLLKRITTSIISPVINREWYNNKNNYVIGNFDHNEDIPSIGNNYLLSILNRLEYFSFKQNVPSRPSWLKVDSNIRSNGVNFMKIKNCSYRHEDLIDFVQVSGFHVGIKTIAVPFKRFFYIEENKNVVHIENTNKSKLIDFVISHRMNSSPYQFMTKYQNEITKYDYLKDSLISNNCQLVKLWVNKNYDFNNLDDNKKRYFEIVEKIHNICDENYSVHCNSNGISICIDDAEYNPNLLNDIIKMCKQLFNVFQ